jgi:hypothetical protein
VKFNRSIFIRAVAIISLIASLTALSGKIQADTGNCGGVSITLPFNDVMASPFFCQIAAAYYSGLTNGTGDGTTYSPTQTVTREQMVNHFQSSFNNRDETRRILGLAVERY